MKIILSRKGFDSQLGGVPSPIFPCGEALSLPIPARLGPTQFRDLRWRGASLAQLVSCLTGGKVPSKYRCHLDPDLRADSLPRSACWRPAFGQVGPAQSHLKNQGVGPGDVFLFFGWFRPVKIAPDGSWRYVRSEPAVHRLFGWLQVSEVVNVGSDPTRARNAHHWLRAHPHLNGDHWKPNNTVYIAARDLVLDGRPSGHPGGGAFRSGSDRLRLTAPATRKCSTWMLPEWFWPTGSGPMLSYHRDEKRWERHKGRVQVESVGRGQEFVFDANGIPEASKWLLELLQ